MRREIQGSESGYVTVWLGVCLLALMMFAGLAIDLANWHLQAAKIQRSADAAAMAGVTRLPNEATARAAVDAALEKNGTAPDADVVRDVQVLQGRRLKVEVKNKKVETVFASFIVDHIKITRSATAEYRNTIQMGNPFNMLGTGDFYQDRFRDIRYEGYVLAINGHCTAAEEGDLFASRYDGNRGVGNTASECDQAGLELNPHYEPITAKTGGYDYILKIPSDSVTSHVHMLDPGFNPGAYNTDFNWYSRDISKASNVDPAPAFPTQYRLFSTHSDTIDDPFDDTLLTTKTFNGFEPDSIQDWDYMERDLEPGQTYRLNVTTPDDGTRRSYGINAYQLQIVPKSGSDWDDIYSEADSWVCDSRFEPRCPTVSAINALSVQTLGSDPIANLFLTSLDASYAGDAIEVNIHDSGEQAKSIRLIRPDLGCQRFRWFTPAKLNVPAISDTSTGEMASSDDCNSDASALSVAGESEQIINRISKARFNDRMVSMEVRLPNNYQAIIDSANGTTYWKIRYESTANYSLPSDRTTWQISLLDGGPVRLIRD